jgi:hypothetical protein
MGQAILSTKKGQKPMYHGQVRAIIVLETYYQMKRKCKNHPQRFLF